MTGLLVILTMFFGWNLQYLKFDFEFEKFFPKDDPDSKLYQQHVAQFGYDNDFMQIILQNDSSVFDPDFLTRASAFEKALQRIEDVETVYSPLSLQHVVKSPSGLVVFPLIHPENREKLMQDSIRIYENDFYRAAFSDDGKALSIYLGHAHFDDPERSEKLLSSIRSKAETYGLKQVRLVGKLSASLEFIQYIRNDFGKFLAGSLILSFVILLFLFRSLKSSLLPFLISFLSIVWLFGLLGLLGFKINLLSSLLPPILFFVSMSDAIHLMNALKKTRANSKKEEIQKALRIVWLPTLLTSVTTAIGFLSLIWINTEPVQTLGLFAAIGILFAFVITFTLGLLLATITRFTKEQKLIEVPERLLDLLLRRKVALVSSTVILLVVLIPGIFRLKIDSFLLDDLPRTSRVKQDFEYVDSKVGGSKPYEIRIEVIDSSLSVWDKQVMDEIVKIEHYMLNEYPVSKVQSPATIIKYLTMVNNGGLNNYFLYPNSDAEFEETIRLKKRIDPKRMDKLVTEDGKVARLIGFIPEWGSYETGLRNERLKSYLDQHIDTAKINYRITGTTYLIDKSHELLSKNLLQGLLTAIGVIGLVLGLYFKSWKLLLISLIPNLIPLMLVAGIVGWLGISLKMTTSIIFTISFGIAVDDTIHMMSYYLRNTSSDPKKRMKETFRHAGSAMLITSLIMTVGFALFLFSSFGATFYMGLFVSLSLSIALITDLTILPLLLITFKKHAQNRR